MHIRRVIIILVMGAFGCLLPFSVSAATFRAESIVSDAEFTSASAMSLSGIGRFLGRYPGILSHTQFVDLDGVMRSAAEIIYRAAQESQINPQVILATLQKEQSLIEDPNPSSQNLDFAMGYGICDSCSSNDPGLAQYRGFAAQVHFAAARFREYLDHPEEFGWMKIGSALTIDGMEVTPQNNATRALYLYTPHVAGNQKFATLWDRYFAKQYPDGTVVQEADTQNIWLIDNGKRRKFDSYSVFLTRYRPSDLLAIGPSDLDRYEIGTPIHFAEYSLVRSPKGTVYLIVGNTKRGFASREAMRKLGFSPFEVDDVGFDALDDYADGEPITASSDHPVATLLQDRTTGGVYFVQDGFKFPIRAREIMKANFPLQKPKSATAQELAKYPTGSPLGFKEGTLLATAGTPTVFLVSNRLLRPINSAEVFTALGFKWENVIKVSPALLGLHAMGSPIDI